MKKLIVILLCVVLCLSCVGCASGAAKKALVGSKWFSAINTSNSIVVWTFYEDSVERAKYFFDGNGIHESEKEVAEYTVQKDAIKVEFKDEQCMIPFTYEDSILALKAGEFFSPDDIEKELQGYWTLHKRDYIASVSMSTENEYNIHFNNGTIVIESAAKAFGGAPGEYYYYGPETGTYKIGDGKFETEVRHGNEYFFNVYGGKVNVFHYGSQMKRGEGLPGEDGYKFN